MSHSSATKLKGTSLQCKNGCGFFGNPEWHGYCSKCHRELNQKVEPISKKSKSKKVQRSYSDVQELSLGFSKFEEKKKQQAEKRANTLKIIMKRGHTLKENATQSPSKEVFHVGDCLVKELHLKDSVVKDVVKNMKQQIEIIQKHFDKSIDEQSEIMHDFYNFMYNRAETHSAYQDLSSEQIDQLMDKIEQLLMSHLYRNMINQITTECEEKDLELQKRIRSLNWITPQHLTLDIKENSPEVRDLRDKAITDVIEMNAKIAPQEKINTIVKCSKSIINIINLCQGVTASADEFLPTMVYIVLKANPPLLQSNIKYITSFSIPTRLRSGEGAYYFTNLCCAVAFIDNLTAESLNLNEDEFNRYMSGEMPLSTFEHDANASEGLRLMTQNLTSLTAIQDKNNQVMKDLLLLKEDLIKFEESIRKCKSNPALVINPTPYTVPSNVDMSLIPEILRNRVVRAPTEAVLVDLNSVEDQLPLSSSAAREAESSTNSSDCIVLNPVEGVASAQSKSSESNSEQDSVASNLENLQSAMQPLQVALPTSCDFQISSSNSKLLSTLQLNSAISQQYVNIQDLEYPTDVFPDSKNDSVEFGPFESCETAETADLPNGMDRRNSSDPLSPEPNFMEQHLPPPLQPVVVRNTSHESQS